MATRRTTKRSLHLSQTVLSLLIFAVALLVLALWTENSLGALGQMAAAAQPI